MQLSRSLLSLDVAFKSGTIKIGVNLQSRERKVLDLRIFIRQEVYLYFYLSNLKYLEEKECRQRQSGYGNNFATCHR